MEEHYQLLVEEVFVLSNSLLMIFSGKAGEGVLLGVGTIIVIIK